MDERDRDEVLHGEVIEPGADDAWRRPAGGAGRSGYGEVRSWSWSEGASVGPRLPWVGLALVIVGVILLADQFVPAVSLILGAGMVLVGAVLLVRSRPRGAGWQLYGGMALVAVGVVRVLRDLNVIHGSGWELVAIACGLLAIAAWRLRVGGGRGWQLVAALVLGGIGLFQLAGSLIPGFPSFGDLLLPVLLVAAGLLVLRRSLPRG